MFLSQFAFMALETKEPSPLIYRINMPSQRFIYLFYHKGALEVTVVCNFLLLLFFSFLEFSY